MIAGSFLHQLCDSNVLKASHIVISVVERSKIKRIDIYKGQIDNETGQTWFSDETPESSSGEILITTYLITLLRQLNCILYSTYAA